MGCGKLQTVVGLYWNTEPANLETFKNIGVFSFQSLIYFGSDEETSAGEKYDETLICQMIDFLIDNIYIKIGNHLFRQCIGIPIGTNRVPLLANSFLYSYEVEFLRSMKKSNKKLAKAFNLTLRELN